MGGRSAQKMDGYSAGFEPTKTGKQEKNNEIFEKGSHR